MSSYPGFLSPSSPPSSHLHFAMASVAVPTNLSHLPVPDTSSPPELSRPSPAGQPSFDSLVIPPALAYFFPLNAFQVNTPASSHLDESQPSENATNHRSSSPRQAAPTIQSILAASSEPPEASSSSQQPSWSPHNAMGHPSRDPSVPTQVSFCILEKRLYKAKFLQSALPPSASWTCQKLTTLIIRLDALFAIMSLNTPFVPYP